MLRRRDWRRFEIVEICFVEKEESKVMTLECQVAGVREPLIAAKKDI